MLQQIYPSVQPPYAFELNKDFNFSSAHYIPHEEAGKCMNVHGPVSYTHLDVYKRQKLLFLNLNVSF